MRALLERSIELVKGGWCQGCDAETSGGYPTTVTWVSAKKFSCTGSVIRASWDQRVMVFSKEQEGVFQALQQAAGMKDLRRWEDDVKRTQDEVVETMQKALTYLPHS